MSHGRRDFGINKVLCPRNYRRLLEKFGNVFEGGKDDDGAQHPLDGLGGYKLLQPGAQVHAGGAPQAEQGAQQPIGRHRQVGVKRRDPLVKEDAGNRCDKGAHQGSACHGVDWKAEKRHEEGRDNGPPANSVDPPHDAHNEAQGENAGRRHVEPFPVELVADAFQVEVMDSDDRQGLLSLFPGFFRLAFVFPHQLLEALFARGLAQARRRVSNQIPHHPHPDVQQDEGCEQFEVPGVRQIRDADDGADKHPGEGADHHGPGERPDHAAFPVIAVNPARNGDDVEKLVGCADRGACVAEKGHLERQKKECAGYPAHGGEKGNEKGDQQGDGRVDLDAGYRKQHVITCFFQRATAVIFGKPRCFYCGRNQKSQ